MNTDANTRGIKLTYAELRALYRTAKAFPPALRHADLRFEIHAIAKYSDVLDLMIENIDKSGKPVTVRTAKDYMKRIGNRLVEHLERREEH
jgi:hypothetical protein